MTVTIDTKARTLTLDHEGESVTVGSMTEAVGESHRRWGASGLVVPAYNEALRALHGA